MNRRIFWLGSGLVLQFGIASAQIIDEKSPGTTFVPGITAYGKTAVKYQRGNKPVFNITLAEPVVVSVADKPEKWGFFQFPHIGLKQDGSVQAKWSMNIDAMAGYGIDHSGSANSTDGGKTWTVQNVAAETMAEIALPNGDKLTIETPRPINITQLNMPKPVLTSSALNTYTKETSSYYKLNELPADCQAVYFKRLKKGETEWKSEKGVLIDAHAARHSTGDVLPVIWWGDMQVAKDGSLIAGIYPGTFIDDAGKLVPKSNVFFYRSTDNGHSWKIQGRVMYQADTLADKQGAKRMGFTEPAFEILHDGTFVCISRTTDGLGIGPMYVSYSHDMGKTWTSPKAFTGNGVLPKLLQLKNGMLVLSSGRPGVQLRFSADAKTWTDPFEMLPFANEKDQVSCGYTGLLPVDKDSFLLVYSDFNYKTAAGETRKAIKVRQITIKPN